MEEGLYLAPQRGQLISGQQGPTHNKSWTSQIIKSNQKTKRDNLIRNYSNAWSHKSIGNESVRLGLNLLPI